MEFLDRIPAIFCPVFFFTCWSFSSVICCVFLWISGTSCRFPYISQLLLRHNMLQFLISYLFNQSLDTLLPAALRSLNLASNRLEARGYLSVREDLFLAILLLCFNGFASPVFFFVLFIVSSARILPLFSSYFISSDLMTPCCFTTVSYWFVDNCSESKRSSVFFMNTMV